MKAAVFKDKDFQASFGLYIGSSIVLIAVLIYMTITGVIVILLAYNNSNLLLNGNNSPRSFLELVYFLTNSLVAASVWIAIIIARRQFAEAKNSRLVGVYTGLEARWSSDTMVKSRNNIEKLYNEALTNNVVILDYFRSKLPELRTKDYQTYISIMSLADFLEYVGMLEDRKYLNIEDIEPLVGKIATAIGGYLSAHIIDLRQESARISIASGYINPPSDYAYFALLVRKFEARFTS